MNEILTRTEIESRFDAEWVLIADPEVDNQLRVVRGTVVHHPARGLVIVSARIDGPTGHTYAELALDTGATATLIRTAKRVAIGYDPVPDRRDHARVSVFGLAVNEPRTSSSRDGRELRSAAARSSRRLTFVANASPARPPTAVEWRRA